MQRWEYATVTYQETFTRLPRGNEWLEKVHPSQRQLRDEFLRELGVYDWLERAFWIEVPGSEPSKRIVWDSSMETEVGYSFHHIINELGADGWEAISEVVHTRFAGKRLGHERAGSPATIVVRLKRPLPD